MTKRVIKKERQAEEEEKKEKEEDGDDKQKKVGGDVDKLGDRKWRRKKGLEKR